MPYQVGIQNRPIYFIDLTNGAVIPGLLRIPSTDSCSKYNPRVAFGYMNKVVIYCESISGVKVTIYDLAESNEAGRLHLILRNGFIILGFLDLKLKRGSGNIISQNVYTVECSYLPKRCNITYWFGSNKYKAERQPIEAASSIQNWRYYSLFLDAQSQIPYIKLMPGMRIFAFRRTNIANDSLGGEKSCKNSLEEIKTVLEPPTGRRDLLVEFHFNPMDGSLVHFSSSYKYVFMTRSSRELVFHYKYAEVYRRIK
jgi:hypothetical protein